MMAINFERTKVCLKRVLLKLAENGESTGMMEFYFRSNCIIFSDRQLAILAITNPLQVCFCEFSQKYNNHLILFSYFKNSISFKQVGFPSYFLILFRSSLPEVFLKRILWSHWGIRGVSSNFADFQSCNLKVYL